MNWVGGSRSRMIFKQERQKQREFFEKKKMKSKMKLLESSCPQKASLSLDLLNLHVINKIAEKKERSKHTQHVDMCKRMETFSDLKSNVQLPMSPITVPSKICLDDSEIISSQTKTLECRTDENSQNYITKQDIKYEEKVYMTTEAESRNNFHSESNEKQSRQEMQPEFQQYLYGKCASDNGITLSTENITNYNKVKFPLLCSTSQLTKLSLFERGDDFSPNTSNLNKSGKRDVSVQCNFEQKHEFIGHFENNCIKAVDFPNNDKNVEATRRQSSPFEI
ncbi:regulator of DNA class I crossover intermediates 1 isoform X1 [Rhinoderma darwinii]|uniref:regulator of DNA class I crossover intermediates 1 isoform X1 n=1 Tax=Rhinoderma darwinii TaxID=43563 RepID=UPI003F66A290